MFKVLIIERAYNRVEESRTFTYFIEARAWAVARVDELNDKSAIAHAYEWDIE